MWHVTCSAFCRWSCKIAKKRLAIASVLESIVSVSHWRDGNQDQPVALYSTPEFGEKRLRDRRKFKFDV